MKEYDTNDLGNEIKAWIDKWENTPLLKRPVSITDTLNASNIDSFPHIKIVLQILAVLPVTTASVERSISLLRRLKSWLRSTMKNDRLNALAQMMANPDISLDFDAILKEWSQAKNRNIALAFDQEDDVDSPEGEDLFLFEDSVF